MEANYKLVNALVASVFAIGLTMVPVKASLCAPGRQYLSTRLEMCVNCTVCSDGEVVLRPCEIHRDTICGPISELLKFVHPDAFPGADDIHFRQFAPRNYEQQHPSPEPSNPTDSGYSVGSGEIVWRYDDEIDDTYLSASTPETNAYTMTTTTEATPSSSARSEVAFYWDWQAITFAVGIVASVLFFLMITLYSLHQARRWKHLKNNFEADVEELSSRLGLVAPVTTNSKGEIVEAPINAVSNANYISSRCLYLEHLLNEKSDVKIEIDKISGNVYIEESSAPSSPINGTIQRM